MGVRATELRKGTVIDSNGDLLVITEYIHKTPGNLRAIIHIKTKSLTTGATGAMRLGSSDVLEVAYLDKKKAEYLYRESNGDYVFMDKETYDQFHLTADFVGEKMGYVKENETVDVTFHDKTPIGVEIPNSVVLSVIEAEEAVKGNTATNVKKDAKLETGVMVKVPLHIRVGDKVKVNTETGEFQNRVN
jgi:elongation factor P